MNALERSGADRWWNSKLTPLVRVENMFCIFCDTFETNVVYNHPFIKKLLS